MNPERATPETDAIRARVSAGNFDTDDLLRKMEEFEHERDEAREAKLGVGKLKTRELWHKVCEANALRAHIDVLKKLLPGDTTLELGIQRLQRELTEARNKVVALCNDWADDDSRVKAIALQHGIDVDADAAKDGYFRTVVDVVESMSAQLDTICAAMDQVNIWLESCLKCKTWSREWDGDQRDAAQGCLDHAKDVLTKLKQVSNDT